ncbi:MAG: nucleotidyltransferase family protein [Oscillospiraceae bacterium]
MTDSEMKTSAYDMLYLSTCAIRGRSPDRERIQQMNDDDLYAICRFHSLTALVACALESAGITLSDKWREVKAKAIRKNILLDTERAKILEYFEQNGIWYIPLKGIIIKDMYPKAGMRQMADNDILYDRSFQKQVKDYMESNGYKTESVGKGNHDTYHKPPVYNFEMHTQLYSEQADKTIHDYYANVKKRLIKDNDNDYGYHFTDEDFYIFMTVHEYKHYSGGGTGLRSLLDCFVYVRAKGNGLDWDYISRELEKLGLKDFECSSRELCMKVFSGTELPAMSENERDMLEYYLLSGTYGTEKNHVENNMKKFSEKTGSKSKFRYIMRRIFPELEVYKEHYPFFYKHRILLPIGWLYRFFKGIVLNGRKIINELKIVAENK